MHRIMLYGSIVRYHCNTQHRLKCSGYFDQRDGFRTCRSHLEWTPWSKFSCYRKKIYIRRCFLFEARKPAQRRPLIFANRSLLALLRNKVSLPYDEYARSQDNAGSLGKI